MPCMRHFIYINFYIWLVINLNFEIKITKNLPELRTLIKSKDIYIIQSGYNLCGKSKEEVERELKNKNYLVIFYCPKVDISLPYFVSNC